MYENDEMFGDRAASRVEGQSRRGCLLSALSRWYLASYLGAAQTCVPPNTTLGYDLIQLKRYCYLEVRLETLQQRRADRSVQSFYRTDDFISLSGRRAWQYERGGRSHCARRNCRPYELQGTTIAHPQRTASFRRDAKEAASGDQGFGYPNEEASLVRVTAEATSASAKQKSYSLL